MTGRLVISVLTLMLAASAIAEAQTRQNRPTLRDNPYAVQAGLVMGLCWHVAMSVPPEVPDGNYRLGKCPHRSKWPQYQGRL